MKFWERFGIAVMAVWGLFALHQLGNALFAAHHWKGMSAGDWGTWIGSIGTVGALMGTIWLATEERRRRNQQTNDLAVLACASLYFKLARTAAAIERSIELLNIDPINLSYGLRTSYSILVKADRWSDQDLLPLLPLVPMSHRIAARLAMAMQSVETVRLRLESVNNGDPDPDVRYPEDLIAPLRVALSDINSGLEHCERVTGVSR